jgi:hypothetical protein
MTSPIDRNTVLVNDEQDDSWWERYGLPLLLLALVALFTFGIGRLVELPAPLPTFAVIVDRPALLKALTLRPKRGEQVEGVDRFIRDSFDQWGYRLGVMQHNVNRRLVHAEMSPTPPTTTSSGWWTRTFARHRVRVSEGLSLLSHTGLSCLHRTARAITAADSMSRRATLTPHVSRWRGRWLLSDLSRTEAG